MTDWMLVAGVVVAWGLIGVVATLVTGYAYGVAEKKQARLDEALYREFPSVDGEKKEERAQRLLLATLPVFRTRDDAVDAFYMVYPTANDSNRLRSVAAAIYFLQEADKAKRERQKNEFGKWGAAWLK